MIFLPQDPPVGTPPRSLLCEETLENGLIVRFYDGGNRYFGDYHRVAVSMETRLPLDLAALSALDSEVLARARARFGAELVVSKPLERMGVETARVETVRQELVASALHEARRYLARSDYPERLVRAELERKPTLKSLRQPR